MEIKRLVVGPLATNCYLVRCAASGEAVVIDPGADGEDILAAAEELGLKLRLIINTHGHGDHIGANELIRARTGAEILIHQDDAEMLTSPVKNLSTWINGGVVSPPADRLLAAGAAIACGDITFKVLSTPGHTPGGISLQADKVVFTGDALFKGSIGRTDFLGGSHSALLRGIKDSLLTLPLDTRVYPGHGPETTIGEEKVSNPFLK